MGKTAAKEAPKKEPELKMITGSQGKEDYLLVARKGNMVLGVKPIGAVNGAMKGVPNTTYFVARIRVAPISKSMEEEEGAAKVVTLKQKFDKPAEAWPAIDYDPGKSDAKRASSVFSMFVKGSLSSDEAVEKALMESIADKRVGKKLAEKLVSLIGPEHMVITTRQLVDYTDKQFVGAILHAQEAHAKKKAAQAAAFTALADNFDLEAKVLKEVWAKTNPPPVEGADDEVIEDEDEIMSDEVEDDPDEI